MQGGGGGGLKREGVLIRIRVSDTRTAGWLASCQLIGGKDSTEAALKKTETHPKNCSVYLSVYLSVYRFLPECLRHGPHTASDTFKCGNSRRILLTQSTA